MTHEELVEKTDSAYQAAFSKGWNAEPDSRALPAIRKAAMRAALAVVYEAIREPTNEMLNDGVDAYWRFDQSEEAETSVEVTWTYCAMLDASALKPGEK